MEKIVTSHVYTDGSQWWIAEKSEVIFLQPQVVKKEGFRIPLVDSDGEIISLDDRHYLRAVPSKAGSLVYSDTFPLKKKDCIPSVYAFKTVGLYQCQVGEERGPFLSKVCI